MDALDLMIRDGRRLALLVNSGNFTRVRYLPDVVSRRSALRRLAEARRRHRDEAQVDLAWLAHPEQGDRGWARLVG